MARADYTVEPTAGAWIVRMKGDSVTEAATDKTTAVARALQLARRYQDWSVQVLSSTGAVERQIDSTMEAARETR